MTDTILKYSEVPFVVTNIIKEGKSRVQIIMNVDGRQRGLTLWSKDKADIENAKKAIYRAYLHFHGNTMTGEAMAKWGM